MYSSYFHPLGDYGTPARRSLLQENLRMKVLGQTGGGLIDLINAGFLSSFRPVGNNVF